MAIKRTPKSEINIPAKLDKLLERGFTEQFMSSKFEELFKGTKKLVLAYIDKNDDDFNIGVGKGEGVSCDYGKIGYRATNYVSVDHDKLLALVKAGTITVDQLVECVSKFDNDSLEKTITTAKFKEITTVKTTESLCFTGSAEFKAEMEAKMGLPDVAAETFKEDLIAEAPVPAPAPVAADPLAKAKAASAAAKAAKAKSTKAKSADADLEDILKG